MQLLTVLTAVLALGSTEAFRRPRYGPAGPIDDYTIDICYEDVKYIADTENLCWYWECVETFNSGALMIQMLPRRCALGSRMPYMYETGQSNPCSVNFNTHIDFECTRAQDRLHHSEPDCLATTVCKNNGTAVYEGPVCWCDCLPEWKGNFDCSEPTKDIKLNDTDTNSTDCNFIDPPCDLVNGCENGGICHNQCGDFWCECPVPFTAGKRCEGFSCDTNPCRNGGTCNRGELGISEVSRCTCPAGYSGLLCDEVITQTTAKQTTTLRNIIAAPAETP